jgi:glyoxylase-like metal-dependent hydrolase (beta-lactamase superfamily II)
MDCVYQNGEIRIYKIAESIYFRCVDYRAALQCNSVFLVGKDSVGVVDVSRKESCRQLNQEAEALFRKEIRYVFLTHRHEDHAGGLPWFLDGRKTVFLSLSLYNRLEPRVRESGAAFVAVDRALRANLSGIELELSLPAGVMHCDDEMLIRIPGENAVCVGDCAVDFREFYCLDGNIPNWIYGLEHFFGPQDQLILPGHGMPMGRDGLQNMADNMRLILRAAQKISAGVKTGDLEGINGKTAKQAIQNYLAEGSEDARRLIKVSRGWAEEHLEMIYRYTLRG